MLYKLEVDLEETELTALRKLFGAKITKALEKKAKKKADAAERRALREQGIEPPPSDKQLPLIFFQIWNAYPKKIMQPAAMKAWNDIKPTLEDIEAMMKDIERRKSTFDWQKSDGMYIPMFATYLRNRRWTEPVEEVTVKKQVVI